MKTLLTPTPLIAVEVPENASKPYISASNYPCYQLPWGWKDIAHKEPLEGEWEILGTVDKGVIDFEVVKIIPTYFHFTRQMTVYQDYNNPNDIDSYYISARNSFISLLESHSLSLDKKYLIIKPKN